MLIGKYLKRVPSGEGGGENSPQNVPGNFPQRCLGAHRGTVSGNYVEIMVFAHGCHREFPRVVLEASSRGTVAGVILKEI